MALGRPGVGVELIADGVHVDDAVVDVVIRAAAGRLLLVSDAMAAAGLGDGAYQLAGSPVIVSDGIAHVANGDSLAGGTTSLGKIVTRLAARGVPWDILVAAAVVTPAAALGLTTSRLQIGDRADLVTSTPGSQLRTMRGGQWLQS